MNQCGGPLARRFRSARGRRIAFACVLLLASPTSVYAHGGLKSSSPSRGQVVKAPLRELRLEFAERPELAFTSVRLTGPEGGAIALGQPAASANVVVVRVGESKLSAGRYVITWKTAGRDGHPVTGVISFSLAQDAIVVPTPLGVTEAPPAAAPMPPMEMHHDSVSMPSGRAFDAESPGYVAIRWGQFVALVILIGAFAFRYVVLGLLRRKHPDSPLLAALPNRALEFARLAAIALGLLALTRLIAQSYAMHGENQSVVSAMFPMIVGTSWGVGWLLQVAGCLLVIAGLAYAARGGKSGWKVAAAGAAALALSPAFSGHAASSPQLAPLAILSDAIHVIGAGGWLGSLLFVLAVGIPAAMTLGEPERSAAVADLVNAFSPTALVFAGISAATGVFAAWLHVGSIPGLWETGYGQTLLLKLGILSAVAATGAYNWLRVKPALGKPQSTSLLRRSATVEILIAVAVLAVTAVLVATPSSMDEEMMKPTASVSSQSH